jgi:hypothetical protein
MIASDTRHDQTAARDRSTTVVCWGPRDRAFLLCGAVAVVAGGLLAAVSRPFGWERGPWAAAYLVLVAGVSQIALGVQPMAAPRPAAIDTAVVRHVVAWNAGSVLVLLGTFVIGPVAVTIGGALLLSALAGFAAAGRGDRRPRPARLAYLALVVALAVSVPIGIAMSWGRG